MALRHTPARGAKAELCVAPLERECVTRVLPAHDAAIAQAVQILRAGGVVAFPTETVYGLGADAAQAEAVARIYEAKGRPAFNPLIAHVADIRAARQVAVMPRGALKLAETFWPGPLTIVAPFAAGGGVCDLARAGLPTVALRAPSHPVAQALIRALGRPIVAPSANRSGHVSPVMASHVVEDLTGRIDMIPDGGRTAAGLESTVVSFCVPAPILLRPGAIAREAIEDALGMTLAAPLGSHIIAPGMIASHYAPAARLRLDAKQAQKGEAVLDFAGRLASRAPKDALILDLSPSGDLVEAAANLFAHLREFDTRGATRVAVAPVPAHGLGEAINDRLRRAAAAPPA